MLRNMEYIYAVYEKKSFSRAAEMLYVSQPALSSIVKKTEEEIGLPLFNRSTAPISLTPAGEYYIQSIEKIMAIEHDMRDQFAKMAKESTGSIVVGASTFFCAHVLPALIQEFESLRPGYHVTTMEANTDDLSKCLASGVIDLNLDVDILDTDLFSSRLWSEEHIILAVPSAFPVNEMLTSARLTWAQIEDQKYLDESHPAVSLSHFKNEPFLFLKKGNDMYRRGMKMCKNAGFTPNISMYLDQLLTSYYIARDGHGICFLRSAVPSYTGETDQLCFYKIADKLATRNIYMYYRKNAPLSDAAREFMDFLGERSETL